MKYYVYSLCFLLVANAIIAKAQSPFPTIAYLDVNNIKAPSLVHGDMWWDPTSQAESCEFPKGSGINITFASAIWMSGYDVQGQLYTSAVMFHDKVDYWPGPLDSTNHIDFATSEKWAKIWKINKAEIVAFLSQAVHNVNNTPANILTWPAKGNVNAKGNNDSILSITEDMAPFVDANNDGKYNALDGDYPKIKGDQALWWVFSDNGPTHDFTSSVPLKVEVHAMAYATMTGTSTDNVVYYDYTVINKSGRNYEDYRLGLWSDEDLGYYGDDYVGFDSSHRMGYAYNGTANDGQGQGGYGNNPPMAGVMFIKLPDDNGSVKVPAGSFIYNNNDMTVIGNPANGADVDNYLRSRIRTGAHITNDFAGRVGSKGFGSGPDVNYIYPGDPADTTQWSECSSGNPDGDRRYILASNDNKFDNRTQLEFVLALVATPQGPHHVCGDMDLNEIKRIADAATNQYNMLDITSVSNNKNILALYPNPATDIVNIEGLKPDDVRSINIYDQIGRKTAEPFTTSNNKTSISTSNLPSGIYYLMVDTRNGIATGTFVKQ